MHRKGAIVATDDPELIERLRHGDSQALMDFLEKHRSALAAYIGRRLGDTLRAKVEPDDLVQETATAALRAFDSAHFENRDPFGWLCHLADQRIVDAYRTYVRSQKRSAVREARAPAATTGSSRLTFSQILQASLTTPSQACMRNEQEERVFQALATLPEDQQEALRLHFLQGLPSKEVARRLGKEDVAVRVMLSRAVRKLRTLLEDDFSL